MAFDKIFTLMRPVEKRLEQWEKESYLEFAIVVCIFLVLFCIAYIAGKLFFT